MVTMERPVGTAPLRDPAVEVAAFLRTTDAFCARLAEERGEAYVHLDDEEIEQVSALAAAFGVTAADAAARLAASLRDAAGGGEEDAPMVAQMETEAPVTAQPVDVPPGRAELEERIARSTIQRIGTDPFFIGSTLFLCEERFGVDEPTLADFLGCPVAKLAKLALYPQPDGAPAEREAALARIAAQVGADPEQLTALIEYTER
jgi:hypothetical protein